MTKDQRKLAAISLRDNPLLPEIFEELEKTHYDLWRKEPNAQNRDAIYSLAKATTSIKDRIHVRIKRELGDGSQSQSGE